jgi:hypothetical protein
MKKLGIIIGLLIIFSSQIAFSQNVEKKTKERKKLEKQKLKEEKKKKSEAEWYELKQIISDTVFVFQAGLLGSITVDPKINFLVVDKENVILQFASGYGGGQNGIGGYTINGIIDKYEVKANKAGKAIIIDLTIMPNVGQGAKGLVNISLSAFSFDSVRLNIGSKPGVMQGEIKKAEDSKIFKGNTPN